jgi:hypothetical protein
MSDITSTPAAPQTFWGKMMSFFDRVETIFDKAAPVIEGASKAIAVIAPAFGPTGAAVAAGADAAGTITAAVEAASQAHEVATAAGTDPTSSAVISAGTILNGVIAAAPSLGLSTATVGQLNKVAALVPGPQG